MVRFVKIHWLTTCGVALAYLLAAAMALKRHDHGQSGAGRAAAGCGAAECVLVVKTLGQEAP